MNTNEKSSDISSRKCADGDRFGRWFVIKFSHKNSWGKRYYLCHCDCGKEVTVIERTLLNGKSTSCGCFRTENLTKHGCASNEGKSREYGIYHAMRSRCSDPKRRGYERYGALGVKVCERWVESFENFIVDMGPCPKGCSIDRFPKSNGNYEPSNCRWATNAEQARNKSSNIMIEYKGESLCLADWAKGLGVRQNTLTYRIRKWDDVEKAFTTPFTKIPYRPRTQRKEA